MDLGEGRTRNIIGSQGLVLPVASRPILERNLREESAGSEHLLHLSSALSLNGSLWELWGQLRIHSPKRPGFLRLLDVVVTNGQNMKW